jgi:flagellar hook-associated protein 3 FlgL
MRIATTQYQSTMNQSLQLNQTRLAELTQKMATGKRISVPSDDPVDSVRLSRLDREEASIKQYRANISAIQLRMSKNEGFLQNMVNDLIPGRDLLVWSSDGANTPDDLGAMVQPLTTLLNSLFYNANAMDQEGRYIFAGTKTDKPPFVFDGTSYSYQGNTDQQLVVVGNGITQVGNVDLDKLEILLNKLNTTIKTLGTPGVNVNDLPTRAKITAGLDAIDDAIDLLGNKIAVLGGAQNILKTLDANHANVSLSNQMAITDIGQLDMAEAATSLNGYQTALQASYKAYSKIGTLSLFAEI